MNPVKSLFSLTSRGIERCVVAMGRHIKTKTELAATSSVLKKDYYYEIRISHHFCAYNRIFSQLHLCIGGVQ